MNKLTIRGVLTKRDKIKHFCFLPNLTPKTNCTQNKSLVYITLSFASFFLNFPEGSETINNFILSLSLLRNQRQVNNNLTSLHENTLTNFF